MKSQKKSKKIDIKYSIGKQVKKATPKQIEEQENLLFKAKQLSPANKVKKTDQIIERRGAAPLNVSAYVRNHITEHSVHFFKPFFYAIADVFLLDRHVMDTYVKPKCVPRFINRYVYGRFPNAVLRRIREKNPLLEDFTRESKNFQFLTDYADRLLRQYIEDAIRVLRASRSYKEFREKFVQEFGIANQTELFED
jgi:P63C domain